MKLLLNEMLSPKIARKLRDKDHDVIAISENEKWISLTDDEVINLARDQHRVVVTVNLCDYRPLAAQASLPGGSGHFGMVFVPTNYRLTKADIGSIVTALHKELIAHPDEDSLYNQEIWI